MNTYIRDTYRSLYDGDPWGTAMSVHFAIADLLHAEGLDIPAEWGYSNPSGNVDPTDYAFEDIAHAWTSGYITADELRHAGNVLHRFEDYLTRIGRDY